MIDPELKSFIESEIADFYAGLLQPGEPETIEESQREITQRVLMVIEHWCANRVKNRVKPQRFIVPLKKMSVEEVMHRCGFDREYAEGWCSANDWAINEVKLAGGEIAE